MGNCQAREGLPGWLALGFSWCFQMRSEWRKAGLEAPERGGLVCWARRARDAARKPGPPGGLQGCLQRSDTCFSLPPSSPLPRGRRCAEPAGWTWRQSWAWGLPGSVHTGLPVSVCSVGYYHGNLRPPEGCGLLSTTRCSPTAGERTSGRGSHSHEHPWLEPPASAGPPRRPISASRGLAALRPWGALLTRHGQPHRRYPSAQSTAGPS